jgi:hypothetical protein
VAGGSTQRGVKLMREYITRNELKEFNVRYHRNGIGGEGFHVCRFVYDGQELQAVVFDGVGQVAITGINIFDRFRGDMFEPVIRNLIEESNK